MYQSKGSQSTGPLSWKPKWKPTKYIIPVKLWGASQSISVLLSFFSLTLEKLLSYLCNLYILALNELHKVLKCPKALTVYTL